MLTTWREVKGPWFRPQTPDCQATAERLEALGILVRVSRRTTSKEEPYKTYFVRVVHAIKVWIVQYWVSSCWRYREPASCSAHEHGGLRSRVTNDAA
jgi:hypothetical protein